jgi:hypothetical protein
MAYVITPILKFIAGVLQSKFAEEIAPSLIDEKYVETIRPQLDRVEKAINDLKMKGEYHGQADHWFTSLVAFYGNRFSS